jgi:hypothetical protein
LRSGLALERRGICDLQKVPLIKFDRWAVQAEKQPRAQAVHNVERAAVSFSGLAGNGESTTDAVRSN